MDHFARLDCWRRSTWSPRSSTGPISHASGSGIDRFVGRPRCDERREPRSKQQPLNDAYRTLKNPVDRAVYLAAVKGVRHCRAMVRPSTTPTCSWRRWRRREALHEAGLGGRG